MRYHKNKRNVVLSSTLGTTLVAGLVAAALPVTTHADSNVILEEILVSAGRIERSLADMPAAVTVISGDAIASRDILSFEDIGKYVPGMSVGNSNGSSLVAIRGLSQDISSGNADPSAAIYLDGVYYPRTFTTRFLFDDVAAVEILKGPQGALYGRNATAGAVLIQSPKPSDQFEGSFNVLAGNYNRFKASGNVSLPVNDELSVRLSGSYEDRDGYGRNLANGDDADDVDGRWGAKLAVNYQPTDKFNLDFSARSHAMDSNGPGNYAVTDPVLFTNPFVGGMASLEAHELHDSIGAESTAEQDALTLAMEWDLTDNVQFKSVTGYIDDFYQGLRTNVDVVDLRIIEVNQTFDSDTFSQEFTLSGKASIVEYVGGVLHISDNFEYGNNIPFYDPFSGVQIGTFDNATELDAESNSIFADATISITDKLRLLAGIRYTKDDLKFDQSVAAFGFPLCSNLKTDIDYSATTKKVGLQWDASDTVNLYSTWQEGFKAGGFNANNCGETFNPEEAESFEVGAKLSLLDQRLNLNIAAYRTDYSQLQFSQIVGGIGASTQVVKNVGEARSQGVEIESFYQISDNLNISLGLAYMDAEYTEDDGILFLNEFLDRDESIVGNRLSRAPEWATNLGVEYTVPVTSLEGGLTFRGEYNWSDDINYSIFNSEEVRQSSFSLVNLYLTFFPDSEKYSVALFAKNINDEEYFQSANYTGTSGSFRGTWGAPRTYGASLTWNF